MRAVLTPDDIRRLEECAAETHPMDYCIILLLTRTGARASEIASLRLDSILNTPTGPQIRFLTLKEKIVGECSRCHTRTGRLARFCPQCGAKAMARPVERRRERLIPVGEDVAEAIWEYRRWRDAQPFAQGSPWLFPSPVRKGMPISRQHICVQIVYPIAEAAGLGGRAILLSTEHGLSPHRVSPHRLRDALATSYVFAKGASDQAMRELQEFLGHRQVQTTAKYAKVASLGRVSAEVARAITGRGE